MLQSSYLEISRSALKNNLDFIRSFTGPDVKFCSVIKGNAYGHGIEEFAGLAQTYGADYFAVFSADEAERLLKVIKQPSTIIIMGYLADDALEWAINHDIEFFVFEKERLEAAVSAARKCKKPALVHIEIETGMNRTGFVGSEITSVLNYISINKPHVIVKGVCTHYAGAESFENKGRVEMQQELFQRYITKVKKTGTTPELIHSACSAAMIIYPETHQDLVRVGIMQYGFWPSPESKAYFMGKYNLTEDPLKRLITWKSSIMSLKHVSAGNYIGYGTAYKAMHDMVIGIVPVGYAWGYSRLLSNQGQVLVRGKRVQVIGTVNMNVMMIDLTEVPEIRPKEEVILLGGTGDESITVASFGELSIQLNYELLTRLPGNIPRLLVD
jgi:alanine racemase